jgi:hypothetical protein
MVRDPFPAGPEFAFLSRKLETAKEMVPSSIPIGLATGERESYSERQTGVEACVSIGSVNR